VATLTQGRKVVQTRRRRAIIHYLSRHIFNVAVRISN
jgi:hypothetical protein